MQQSEFWRGRPTFVTGATGLMGGWVVRQLLDLRAKVIVLRRDRVPTSVPSSMLMREGLHNRVCTVNGRIEDLDLLRRALAEYEVDTVFHLAAQPLVGVAKKDPLSTLETNVRGTWNVLEAARLTGVKNTVIASSDKAYGDSEDLPRLETHPLQGKYPYDVSKSCTDLIAQMYAATYRLSVCIVRCANLFGGGDLNFDRAIPGVIAATIRGENFVIRSDGRFVRDFIYVKDATNGYLTAARKLAENPDLAGEAFNLSLGVPLNVLEITGMVLRLMDRQDLKPVILNEASSEIREQYMLCKKAHQVLGWRPKYSMKEGLKETIAWYRTHLASLGIVEERTAVTASAD
jgi:CDP-glucose 4,6-dehydratase